jgi:hypothetical protein
MLWALAAASEAVVLAVQEVWAAVSEQAGGEDPAGEVWM